MWHCQAWQINGSETINVTTDRICVDFQVLDEDAAGRFADDWFAFGIDRGHEFNDDVSRDGTLKAEQEFKGCNHFFS
ncbi:MAG: hypothetical protein OXD29_05590 [Roseovarius sp.]|nr:hypothetical protein [Roseovarius sp.]MCY4290575.1 hypothetical protein [Roseovarius sp.]MCY4315451.1 hypothetical protein [Roseovarius sp.]